MATENRRRFREQSDPLLKGARKRLSDSALVLDRASHESLRPRPSTRPGRPSIRPSAFGIPRRPSSDPAIVTTVVERVGSPMRSSSIPAPPSEPPRVSQTLRKKEPATQAVTTDIEELLPISQGVKSLPRPPKLPTFEAPALPAPATRRFPWMSLSIFAVVIGASLAPLVRYRGERTVAVATHRLMTAREVDWGALAPFPSSEHTSSAPAEWAVPRTALLEEGDQALGRGELRVAERAFVDALASAHEDPSASFGLARVRLAQGDLVGALAWARAALRRRPLDARYRSIVEGLGGPRPER